MNKSLDSFWLLRLEKLKKNLEANQFEAFLADTADHAKNVVLTEIIPNTQPGSLAWGGSMSFKSTGLYDELKGDQRYILFDNFKKGLPFEEDMKLRHQGLQADLYITGTNAVTDSGQLVNLDMIGNRVAAITFGPKNVVIIVGRNKIVPDIEQAMNRIKNIAAPANSLRLKMKTPCTKSGQCENCQATTRICNVWTIHEKSFPKGRIKVVLVNEDLGL